MLALCCPLRPARELGQELKLATPKGPNTMRHLSSTPAIFAMAFLLCVCNCLPCAWAQAGGLLDGGTKTAAKTDAKPAETPEEPAAPRIRDLGPPQVENPKELKRLHPQQPVWLDVKQKRVVLVGEVCAATYGLEFLVTNRGREYEAIAVSDVKPSLVHAGLLALGAVPGKPAKVYPKFEPPSGTEIEIDVYWKDKAGKLQHARAQDWIRNTKTKKTLDMNWVFGGSGFQVDETTGKRTYLADAGDFVSVANVPIATLDLPTRSASALEDRQFEAIADRMPPKGTPVTIVLMPKLPKKR
jgi:hypothetical protein